MRPVNDLSVCSREHCFELEADELFGWPRIEYRMDYAGSEPELILTAVRFHGVNVLERLSPVERRFYWQQCYNHRLDPGR